MRKGEVSSIVISIISAIGVVMSSFWISAISPYLLGMAGGALHAIAAHENGVNFGWVKILKIGFVSLFGGWIGMVLSSHVAYLKEYSEVFVLVGGFLSWELLMITYERKDSLVDKFFNTYSPLKGDKKDD